MPNIENHNMLFCTGMLVGLSISIRGVWLALKSSYKNLDAVMWCFVGTGVIQITTIITAILLSHVTL